MRGERVAHTADSVVVIFRGLIRVARSGHMKKSALLVVSLALVTAAGAASAQSTGSSRRNSYTIGISKGAGALTCPFCTNEGKGGIAGMLGMETTWRPGVRLGVEADWWMHSGGGSSRSVLAAVPVTHLYLDSNSPLFFKLGVGIARFTASSDEEELRTTAVSGILGAGYEFRLSGRNVLVPYVSLLSGSGGTMRLNGSQVTPLGGVSLIQYGIALSRR